MPLAEESKSAALPPPADIDAATVAAYWKKTSALMWTVLAVWFFFSFVIHIFAPSLNTIRILGFPLGFYFAAQGSLIVFVVLLFWFARRQNEIDQEFGVQEES